MLSAVNFTGIICNVLPVAQFIDSLGPLEVLNAAKDSFHSSAIRRRSTMSGVQINFGQAVGDVKAPWTAFGTFFQSSDTNLPWYFTDLRISGHPPRKQRPSLGAPSNLRPSQPSVQ